MLRILSIAATGLVVASCGTPQPYERTAEVQADLTEMLEGRAAGEPVNCLPFTGSGDITVLDENTVVYRQGATLYLQEFDHNCSALGAPGYTMVTELASGRLCSGEVARVVDVDTGMMAGTCRFNDFTPYKKASRD